MANKELKLDIIKASDINNYVNGTHSPSFIVENCTRGHDLVSDSISCDFKPFEESDAAIVINQHHHYHGALESAMSVFGIVSAVAIGVLSCICFSV